MTNYIQQSRATLSSSVIYDVNNQMGENNSSSGDGDSWFVSYADILLLLLTFFVLLFAFSRVEGVGANEEIDEDADRVMASSMEQNDSAEVLVTKTMVDDTMLNQIQKPLAKTHTNAPHIDASIGTGRVSVIHELVADSENSASNDGIKIDALIDEQLNKQKVFAERVEQTTLASVTIQNTDIKNNFESENQNEKRIEADLAMYETVSANENVVNDVQQVSNTQANLVVEANLVALTVDEQLAKLSVGLTSSEVEISTGYQSINIELNNKILFPLGEAKLLEEGELFLNEIATIMDSNEYFASVEGHTDNTPIATSQFPSNWELSSSRATSVARYLISQGVAANRLRAIGYADTKPKVENIKDEDRARNRRVSITFHYDSDAPLS